MTASLTATTTAFQAKLVQGAGEAEPVGLLAHVFLGGRRIWTFRVSADQWNAVTSMLDVDWPAALVPHLSGATSARLEICHDTDSGPSQVAEGVLSFDGPKKKLDLVDPLTGAGLVVNKWGRLAKSFETAGEDLKQEVLVSAKRIISLLRESLGLETFVTGGTLLGLVRDGKLISNDDDADVAYVSRHQNPSDVVLESYDVERVLAGHGLETVRHSSGHLQVMFGGTGYTDGHYVDIFTYFVTEGWFYGTFHARERANDVTIFPLGTLSHDGLELPVPANSGQLLQAIYGPNWQTPDPAFTFETPEAAGRRFYWWLNHFDPFREDWEDYHRGLISKNAGHEPSALALWLAETLEPGSAVLELGCGLGADAITLAKNGMRVLACDYSRPAIAFARAQAAASPHSGPATFEVANVNSLRHVAALVKSAAEFAGPGKPINVVSRNLFDNLHYLGRDNALLAISHLLSRGGQAFLQVRNPKAAQAQRDVHEPVGERIFDPWEFKGRLAHYGLRIVDSNFVTEPGPAGSTLSYVIGKVPNK